jgi:hypothetical protein
VSGVCIVSIAPLASDARVLRQVEYLSRDHDVTVCALPPMPPPSQRVTLVELPTRDNLALRVTALSMLLIGRVAPGAYDVWLRLRDNRRVAMQVLREGRFDAIVANEWPALFIALLAVGTRVPVVFDAHEYSPEEFDDLKARMLFAPLAIRTIRRAAAARVPTITVTPAIAERYRREFGLEVTTVLNAPRLSATTIAAPTAALGRRIRLVHHGAAIRARRLELMIDALALADARFDLTFMLVGDARYIEELKARAEARAPGRIHFASPVPPREIVTALASFDLGIFILETHLYNYAMSLPNKMFDFVAAGLGVVIGPSPAMAELGGRYGFTRVADDFTPAAMARALGALTGADIARMRSAALVARSELNADVEMPKFVGVVERAIASPA